MTVDEAIEILDPERRETYESFDDVLRNKSRINEACEMGMHAIMILKNTKGYRCYHENHYSNDADYTANLNIFFSKDDVARWITQSIDDKIMNGFKIDEDTVIDVESIKNNVNQGSFNLRMFYEHHENWDCFSDIKVESVPLEEVL